jgi:hypothetical protein
MLRSVCDGSMKCSDHVVPGDVADSAQYPLAVGSRMVLQRYLQLEPGGVQRKQEKQETSRTSLARSKFFLCLFHLIATN